MESNFQNRDFEQFIKQNADQYRMFPSEKVWSGVNSVLHTRRKWYGLWLGVILLLSGGTVTWVMTSDSSRDKSDNTPSVVKTNSTLSNTNSTLSNGPSIARETDNLFVLERPAGPENEVRTLPNALIIPEFSSPFTSEMRNITEGITSLERETVPFVDRPYIDNSHFISEALPSFVLQDKIVMMDVPGRVNEEKLSHAGTTIPNYFTIENVVNAYQYKKVPKKISWQLFVTPTVSYRKLSLKNSFDNPAASNYPFAYRSDVNSFVTHKPDVGLQMGIAGRYPVSKSVNIRGGFQFNINRYDIKAYSSNSEIATIDLNGSAGNNSISTWTNYRNYNGYGPDWLKNFYFSFSLPIGAELKLFGNDKTNFGIASTLQPTYMLSDDAYLISTDYKNYAEVPRLIRHVNLNTSFEAFVNYTKRGTKWQIGPQVRYQLLSSFQNKYPVKENLFDFGVKLGVTISK
jgi:hypothetical protein